MRYLLNRIDRAALVVLTVMAVAALYETAVALKWIPVGDLPGEGLASKASFFSRVGSRCSSGFVVSLFLAAANRRWTPGLALGAVAAALVTAHAYTFDTYYLPTLTRYTEARCALGGLGRQGRRLPALFASLISVMFPKIGFLTTAAVLLVCLFTYASPAAATSSKAPRATRRPREIGPPACFEKTQPSVGEHVVLALRPLLDRGVVPRFLQLGRETRGPYVIRLSDGAVLDQNLGHERNLH